MVSQSQTRVKQLARTQHRNKVVLFSSLIPMAHLAHSGLETLRVAYQCLGLDSPAIEK